VFERIGFQEAVPKGSADSEPLTLEDKKEPPFQFCSGGGSGVKEISKTSATKILPRVVAGEIVRLLNGNTKIGGADSTGRTLPSWCSKPAGGQSPRGPEGVQRPERAPHHGQPVRSNEAAELRRVLAGIALPGDERWSSPPGHRPVWRGWLPAGGKQRSPVARVASALPRLTSSSGSRHGFFPDVPPLAATQQVRQRLLPSRTASAAHQHPSPLRGPAPRRSERRLGITGLLKWLAEQMDQERRRPRKHQLRLERDDNAVRSSLFTRAG